MNNMILAGLSSLLCFGMAALMIVQGDMRFACAFIYAGGFMTGILLNEMYHNSEEQAPRKRRPRKKSASNVIRMKKMPS
jgi:hypothetical protein